MKTVKTLSASALILSSLLALSALPALSQTAESHLKFADLKAWVDDGSTKSVEDLLSKLPHEYLNGYALVYNSRSLQQASFQAPRAILYGADASLILTFNGSPQQSGYKTVETMEFNSVLDRFELREIKFDGPQPSISETNPRACLKCHGEEPRPIWDAYFFWPGTYGSQDDLVRIIKPDDRENPMNDFNFQESKAYTQFMNARESHSRYKFLGNPRDFTGKAFRNKNPNENLNSALGPLNNRTILRELHAPELRPYRYAMLGAFLCAREGGYASSGVQDASHESTSKNEFNLETFVPERLLGAKRGSFLPLIAETLKLNHEEFKRLGVRERELLNGKITDSRVTRTLSEPKVFAQTPFPIAPLRFLLESERGELKNWSLSGFPTKGYEFNNAFSSLHDLFAPLWQSYVDPETDQDLEKLIQRMKTYGDVPAQLTGVMESLYNENNFEVRRDLCHTLQQKSLEALQSTTQPLGTFKRKNAATPIDSPEHAEAVMHTCIQCHSSGYKDAPQFAFDQPNVLRRELKGNGYMSGTLFDEIKSRLKGEAGMQMPPDTKLPEIEKREILNYLEKLNQAH